MYPLPSCCILTGHTPLVTSLWAVIHGLTKNTAAADDSGSRNGDDNCGTLHHQLRDAPITGQSNHSVKGESLWVTAVPGSFLYCAQKKPN